MTIILRWACLRQAVLSINPTFNLQKTSILRRFDGTNPHKYFRAYYETMKHTFETYRDKDPLNILPGMPTGPGMIDTSRMRAVLPVLILRVFAMLRPEGVKRGAWSRLWEVRRMFLSVYKAEIYNFRLWCLNAMKADEIWKRQVREDLGGDAALIRWNKRYARMIAGDRQKQRVSTRPRTRQYCPEKTKVKTDRLGLFRLAPVSRNAGLVIDDRLPHYHCFQPIAAIEIAQIKPIPLIPDDLHEPSCSSRMPVTEQRIPDLTGTSDNVPKLSLDAIIGARNKVIGGALAFNLNIAYLDLEINFSPKRLDPIPI